MGEPRFKASQTVARAVLDRKGSSRRDKPREGAGKQQRPKKASTPAPVVELKTYSQVDAALERSGRGRPRGPVGTMLSIKLPPDLVKRVDAVKAGRTRTETIRVLLEEALK